MQQPQNFRFLVQFKRRKAWGTLRIYKNKTDAEIMKTEWEIKNPTGEYRIIEKFV